MPKDARDLGLADEILNEEMMKNQISNNVKIELKDITFEKQIGLGATADVWKGTYRENDVAIKKLRFHKRKSALENN